MIWQKISGRVILAGAIIAAHIAVIFGPAGCFLLKKSLAKPEEVAFRVKLGGLEPSHAPIVGEPERVRPSNSPGNVPPPEPAAEPEPPPPPEKPKTPSIPAVDDAAKAKQKKLAADRKKQQNSKRISPPKRKKNKNSKRISQPKRKKNKNSKRVSPPKKESNRNSKRVSPPKKQPEAEKKRRAAQNSVHHDSRWDNWDPSKPVSAPGGKNFNRNVKIGTQDKGQKAGKVDGRTPAGGATANEEKYWSDVQKFFLSRWKPPAGVFITEDTAVQVTIKIDASGRVTGKWISRRSPNQAVNDSAELLLKNLSFVPRHPAGATQFTLSLIQDH
ncbi:MAG: TonB family protein [Lentisphaeria bacterium]|nr:TonB family protein [Lentisphaeria bacterium]